MARTKHRHLDAQTIRSLIWHLNKPYIFQFAIWGVVFSGLKRKELGNLGFFDIYKLELPPPFADIVWEKSCPGELLFGGIVNPWQVRRKLQYASRQAGISPPIKYTELRHISRDVKQELRDWVMQTYGQAVKGGNARGWPNP